MSMFSRFQARISDPLADRIGIQIKNPGTKQ